MAAHGSTKPAAGVMTTRPATRPVAAPTSVGLPMRMRSTSIQETGATPRCGHGVDERKRRHAIGRELGARIEPEPAEPQKRGTQSHVRHVVRTIAHQAEPAPLAGNEAEDKAGQARRDVHDVSAGKVERADDVADEAALPAPHHMCQRRVHHDGPHGQKRAHRAELHASGHRARNDGRGDHAESHLEHDVDDAGVSCRAFGRRLPSRPACLARRRKDQAGRNRRRRERTRRRRMRTTIRTPSR